MANDVTFRRVRGRIIPIRKKEGSSIDRTKTAQGVGLVTAGATTAASAGTLAAVAANKAVKFRVNSNVYSKKAQEIARSNPRGSTLRKNFEKSGQMKFEFKVDQSKYNPYLKTAKTSAMKSSGYRTLRKGFRLGGLAVSTALIGSGLKKGYEGVTGKKADTKEEIISNAAGAGATFALSSAYAHKKLGGGKAALVKAVKFGLRAAKIRVP